jgi:signal peptidase II
MPSPTRATASAAHPQSSDRNQPKVASVVPANRFAVYAALAITGCAIDLWSKSAVFAWRGMPGESGEWWIWEGLFGIETALNHGALFGIGQGRSGLFSVLSVIALVGIVYWLFVAKAAHDWLLTIALGLITGGILGNLYDRLGLWGGQDASGATIHAVRDWILIAYGGAELPILGTKWPNFNIADSLLVCGAGLLIWHAFTVKEPVKEGLGESASKSLIKN